MGCKYFKKDGSGRCRETEKRCPFSLRRYPHRELSNEKVKRCSIRIEIDIAEEKLNELEGQRRYKF